MAGNKAQRKAKREAAQKGETYVRPERKRAAKRREKRQKPTKP